MNFKRFAKTNIDDTSIDKRITILMGIVLLFSIFLSYRIFVKSVLENDKYKALADSQHTVKQELNSHRGKILAMDSSNGEITELAINIEKFNVNVVPKNVKDAKDVSEKLSPLLDISENEIFDLIDNDKLYIPPIKKRVDKDLADKIIDLKLAGVLISAEDARYYPEHTLASNILGFVNFEGEGKYGLEGYYNAQFKGEEGTVEALRDTHGRIISSDIAQEVNDGSSLLLTIDINVQYMAEEKIKDAKEKFSADGASIIIMNPRDGSIIAMATDKTYDPNNFNEVAKDFGQSFFNNSIISDTWEPGSIFKPVVMGAGIDSGKLDYNTIETFSNMTVVQGYEIKTAENKAFGRQTMTQVLENSDNVGMVWVGNQMGNDTMYDYLDNFGFGKKTNIDLESESSGSLLEKKKWRDIHRATISFGQGVAVTPLQMALSYSVLANGGVLYKPYIVKKIIKPDGKEINTEKKIINDKVISQETSEKVKKMLVSVVKNGHAQKAQMDGYLVGGKTGTAQIPSSSGGYKENEYNHAFAGFFPVDDPQFVMIVRVDSPKGFKYAESTAVPTFADMARWLVNYYEILPNTS